MAEIREPLILEDKFSGTQNKYISGMEQAAASTGKASSAAERAVNAAQRMSGASRSARAEAEKAAKIASFGFSSEAEMIAACEVEIQKQRRAVSQIVQEYNRLSQEMSNATKPKDISALSKALGRAEDDWRGSQATLNEMTSALKEYEAEQKNAAKAAERAAAQQKKASERAAKAAQNAFAKSADAVTKKNPFTALGKQALKMGAIMFTANRMMSFLKDSMERMPDKIAESWNGLKNTLADTFLSGVAYFLKGMMPGIKKLQAAIDSPSGQKLIQTFRQIAEAAGQAIGNIISFIAFLVQTAGSNFGTLQEIADGVSNAFSGIGNAVKLVQDNFSTILPIIEGVAAALLTYKGIMLVVNAVTALHAAYTAAAAAAEGGLTVAQWLLNTAMNANPIGLIVMAIAALIGAIVAWVNHVGGLKIAWLICLDAIKTGWDYFVAGLNVGIAWVQNLIDNLVIMWSEASTAVANAVGDMKVMALTILQNMVNGAIDIINDFINALNKIPGVNISAVKHVTFATTAAMEESVKKGIREGDLAKTKAEIAANRQARDKRLNDMFNQAAADHNARQLEILAVKMAQAAEKGVENGSEAVNESPYSNPMLKDTESMANSVGGSLGSDVSSIKKEVSMSEEELKSLVDLAQRQYVNQINLTAQTPIINVKGQNTGDSAADRKALADTIRDILIEQSSAGTYLSTAKAF